MEARSITHRARGGSSPSAMHTPRQEDRGLLEASDVESPLTIPSDSDAALPRPSEVRGVLRVMDAAFGADAHVCAAAAPSGGERMGVLAASPASDRGWVARSWSALRDAAASVVRACVGALPERRRDRVAAAALVSVLSSVLLFVWLRRLRGRSAAPAIALRAQLRAASERGIVSGALHPLSASHELVTTSKSGMPFFVTTVDPKKVARKDLGSRTGSRQRDGGAADAAPRDAFQRVDPRLKVADIHDKYNLVLNLYPVIPEHAVLVTKAFVPQSGTLSVEDIAAMWHCVRELDAIGFYNSGPESGASQPRRHMQLIPMDSLVEAHADLGADLPPVGVQTLISAYRQHRDWMVEPGAPFRLPDFRFRHAVCLNGHDVRVSNINAAAAQLHRFYLGLLDVVSSADDEQAGFHGGSTAAPTAADAGYNAAYYPESYNMLISPTWMMVVPRSQAQWGGLAINSLGYAGLILVKPETAPQLRAAGDPMNVLRSCGVPLPLSGGPH